MESICFLCNSLSKFHFSFLLRSSWLSFCFQLVASRFPLHGGSLPVIMAFAQLLRLACGLMERLSRTGSTLLLLPKSRIEMCPDIGSTDTSIDRMNMRVAHVYELHGHWTCNVKLLRWCALVWVLDRFATLFPATITTTPSSHQTAAAHSFARRHVCIVMPSTYSLFSPFRPEKI